MLKPMVRQSLCDRLPGPDAGRIDSRSAWTRLKPTHSYPASEAPRGYALDIMTCVKSGVPGLVHDHGHAWIRLVQPSGQYCSIGFFPDESTGVEPDEYPGLTMPGMLLSPDKYDRVSWNDQRTRIDLDRRTFDTVTAWIETLQAERSRGSLAFDLVDRSCVGFVVRAAAKTDVVVEASMAPSRFLLDPILSSVGLTRLGRIPIIPRAMRQAIYNTILASLGGFVRLDRQWRNSGSGGAELETVDGLSPLFSGWREIFRNRVPFYHVRALRVWQMHETERTAKPAPLVSPLPDKPGNAKPPYGANANPARSSGKLDEHFLPQ